jgi:SAM-dependent methyltransferase
VGIPIPLAEIILSEHLHQPLTGRLLSLGRQTILFNESTLDGLLACRDIKRRPVPIMIDNITVEAKLTPERQYMTDSSFFSAFSDAQHDVVDVTDYEGATIVHDMCNPPPPNLLEKFDFIFNGSVLDNIFDPAAALRSMTRMLKPNGRVIHAEMASNLAFEYLIYSPDWFLDYYVANGFADCKVYVVLFSTLEEMKFGPWRVYAYSPRGGDGCSLRQAVTNHAALVIIAEKSPDSTWDRNPVQWCYRNEQMKTEFLAGYKRFGDARPLYTFGGINADYQQFLAGGFTDCGVTRESANFSAPAFPSQAKEERLPGGSGDKPLKDSFFRRLLKK